MSRKAKTIAKGMAVEDGVAINLLHIGLLCSRGIMLDANDMSNLDKQLLQTRPGRLHKSKFVLLLANKY